MGLVGAFAAALSAAILAAAGCGTGAKPAAATPADGPLQDVLVTVACPSGPRGDLVAGGLAERHGRAWAARTGARVQVVRYDPSAGPAACGPADVWVLPPAAMPRWAAAGALQPIPASLYEDPAFDRKHILPAYQHILLKWDGAVQALPLLGDSWLCFYRDDLFRDAREQAGYRKFLADKGRPVRDPEAPQTWEEFADLAEYFSGRPRSGSARPCPSLPALSEEDDDLNREFYAVAAPFARRAIPADERPIPPPHEVFPFHYDLDGSRPRINEAGFVHALQLLQRLQRYRRPGRARQPEQAFLEGEAVLCLASPAWIVRFQEDRASRVRGKFAFCRLPGSEHWYDRAGVAQPAGRDGNRIPYLGAGGWLAVVPRAAAHADAAFNLLAYLSGPEVSAQVVLEPSWGGGGFRQQHFDDRGAWNAFGLNAAQTTELRRDLQQTQNPTILNPAFRLRLPDEAAHVGALVRAVRSALIEEIPAQQALDGAAQAWKELDARKKPEERRRDYRLSLGLTAQP
jgi:multiple sugar transport system substrate-binding protein